MKKIQVLKELTSNILETMFYIMEETQPFNIVQNYKYAATIKDENIEIILMFCEKTARMMTENFLGMESDEMTETDIEDTIKEAINIIAGNYVRTAFEGKILRIGIPTMIENIARIVPTDYEIAMLFFKEEPIQVLIK